MQNTLAEKLLDERGWLPIYLGSAAVIAFADHDARTAARAITLLHELPESRGKAVTITMTRTALDARIAADPTLDTTVVATQRAVDQGEARAPGRLAAVLRRFTGLLLRLDAARFSRRTRAAARRAVQVNGEPTS
jgi:hypothetical protein